jgi:hypothetical protein
VSMSWRQTHPEFSYVCNAHSVGVILCMVLKKEHELQLKLKGPDIKTKWAVLHYHFRNHSKYMLLSLMSAEKTISILSISSVCFFTQMLNIFFNTPVQRILSWNSSMSLFAGKDRELPEKL